LAINRIEGCQLTRWRGSATGDARRFNGFRPPQQFPRNVTDEAALFRNNCARDELDRNLRWLTALFFAREFTMRNRILAIAAVAGAMAAPIAAQAQSTVTTGVVREGPVIINDDEGIAVAQRPAFREYIVRERVPNYTVPDRVIVGGVLPEAGVTYYDVPQTFGATPYRYTVVNGQTVLVEPRTRRIVQVVE
jgi:hypothetical protein